MALSLLWLGLFPCALASWVPGSKYAGASSAAVYPAPHVTHAPTSYFPEPSVVGYAGPTQTGDEPEAIATALPVLKTDTYPLTEPQVLLGSSAQQSSSFNPARYWGNMCPYFSTDSATYGLPEASPQIPDGCELTQVHLLQRHGSRYPASGDPPAQFADRLNTVASTTGFKVTGPLAFLNNWTYKLGAEILTAYGRKELFDLGVTFRMRYGELLKGFTDSLPVFRTTSEERMVQSAENFAAGMFGIPDYLNSYDLQVQIEEWEFNSTLAPWNNCPNANGDLYYLGIDAMAEWESVYLPPAVKRLQPYIQGMKLTTDDVYSMQNLCIFETISLGFSEFCGLFTQDEWKDFEYSIDLEFWYSDGPGNPTTSSQGIGYIEEMVARLTNTPMNKYPKSTTNSTYDNNDYVFPLNQPMYFDFTHDTVIAAVLSTMSITNFNTAGPMPLTHRQAGQTYTVQNIAPFAANLVGQVMQCPSSITKRDADHSSSTESFIRWILNDGVLPLTSIKPCAPYANKDGLCPLDAFVTGMKQIIDAEDWNFDCYGNYTVGVPNNVVDGRYHPGYTRNITLH